MITSSDVYTHHNRRCFSRPAQYHMEMSISNISRDKSFVDDLNKEQGIVSMRVGSALRSTEIKPLFLDLWRNTYVLYMRTTLFVFSVCLSVCCFANSNQPPTRRCTGEDMTAFAGGDWLTGWPSLPGKAQAQTYTFHSIVQARIYAGSRD